MRHKHPVLLIVYLLVVLPACSLLAQTAPITGSADGQTWTQETLANGLRVIYAPMPNTPVAHVRVLYHVGSRDESPDRQGFAHMFEHMMFRGSAHVAPQEHMKLVGLVGGYSNAYTSFDETVYINTVPASYAEMTLWLEADRMASFKVSPAIFATERNVVSEEWRMRLNRPYGGMFELLMPQVFKAHAYRWTPIGHMAHLQAARTQELQDFFEKYYVPNNAILVVAGNIDVSRTREQVRKYFDWIPGRGAKSAQGAWQPLARGIPAEPAQTQERRLEVKMPAPLPRVMMSFRTPPAASDDMEALDLLLGVLGGGQSSRIYQSLVTTEDPLAVDAGAYLQNLEDGGVMGVSATVLRGKSPADVEKAIKTAIAALRDQPVTAAELEKVKQQSRMSLATRFETAEDVASQLGEEMLMRNSLDRIATARARLEALTPADLQRMARKYLPDAGASVMIITPGASEGPPPGAPTTQPAATEPADLVIKAHAVDFPAGFPTAAPMTGTLPAAVFEKGVEKGLPTGAGAPDARVIVMEDHRMPVVSFTLALRAGGHAQPKGKEGLGGLTAEMVRRGPKGKTFDQFNEDLESRAIELDVSDGGDVTRISGTCLKEQLNYAIAAAHDMLAGPAFDAGEFKNLQNQATSQLRLALNNPTTLAERQLARNLFGDSPMGRLSTIESLSGITLEDVRSFYTTAYRASGALVVVAGDVSVTEGQSAAAALLANLPAGSLPAVDYTLPAPATKQRIVLIDKPDAQQSAIQMGAPAYSLLSDEKFAGSLTNQILSAGIESRLGTYVRAQSGFVYDVSGIFSPERHGGAFYGDAATRFTETANTITAMYKVFDGMKAELVPERELADGKFRVSGNLLMGMQTVRQQATRRLEGMLNGYPIDYFDKYATRLGQVTAAQVKEAVSKYVQPERMTIVVVGPAETLKPQLEKLGPVEVIPVP